MYLKNLHLRCFRNYRDQRVQFQAQKTILVGNNAQGKSNLLEAVELLATLKSHRANRDRELILEGEKTASITARLERIFSPAEILVTLRHHNKRSIVLNQERLRRNLELLGTLNAVQFSSLDLDVVRGGPDCRRNWLDTLLIQLEPVYAKILQQYQQVLKQRNALLKAIRHQAQSDHQSANSTSPSDLASLDTSQLTLWDTQLAEAGSRVTRRRARILKKLAPLAQQWHTNISHQTEVLTIQYCPNIEWESDSPEAVQAAFLAKIEQRRIAEQNLGTSVVGPHRDEIVFTIDGTPARSYGSQGQQRTLVLALKLAELNLIEEIIGEPPLLLLDDVLAELDPQRQNQLLDTIQCRFQTIITTTHINSFDAQWLKDSQILTVKAGQIQSMIQ